MCFLSSARGFGGSQVGRVLLITLSSILGPADFDVLCRVGGGVAGSGDLTVVGVGKDEDVGRGSAEVEAALPWVDCRFSGEGGALV